MTGRLKRAADSWSILCTERTVHAAGTGFAFDPIIAIAAKGKRTPIRAAPLLRRTATARLRVPLIGRDTDLATRALELFEQMGAAPYAARARCERARLMEDEDSHAAGIRTLIDLGDLDQLARIEQSG